MQRNLQVLGLLAGLALVQPAWRTVANAAEPVVLARQGSWNLNYDKDGCSLQAAFGTGDGQIILQMTRFAPDGGFTISIIGKGMKSDLPESTITVDFGPERNPQKVDALNGTLGDSPMKIFYRDYGIDDRLNETPDPLPALTAEQEAAVNWLEIGARGKVYHLELGRMNKPMIAFRQCTADLVRSWNLDPATMANLRSGPLPLTSPGTWITSQDYPTEPLRKGNQALVNFRLIIDEAGKVASCSIQRATQGPAFEKLTCDKVMKRARFKPAIDATGKPVSSYYLNRAHFVIR